MEVYVDDETKLTLHGLQQYYLKLQDREKNRKLLDALDALEFNQVRSIGRSLLTSMFTFFAKKNRKDLKTNLIILKIYIF